MIARYCRPEMLRAWCDERRLERWLEVELAATGAREDRGWVPAGTTSRLAAGARLDRCRMEVIEADVGHDVIAFLTMLGESAGADARHLHVGMTSSDLVDTALALQIGEAGAVLAGGVRRVRRAAWELAQAHRRTVMVGRTHGMHAEPITFGLKCLSWSEELGRDLARLGVALEDCAVGKLSGAVGTLAHLDAATEAAVLGAAGTAGRAGREPGGVPRPSRRAARGPRGTGGHARAHRDRGAPPATQRGARGGGALRREAEGLVRHAAQAEPGALRTRERPRAPPAEATRRPASRTRRCGTNGTSAIRRSSASSCRTHSWSRTSWRPSWATCSHTCAWTRRRCAGTWTRAVGSCTRSGCCSALTGAGLARDEAYRIVQEHALGALEGGVAFRAALEADPRVAAVMTPVSLAACFDLEYHLRSVDEIFARTAEPGE